MIAKLSVEPCPTYPRGDKYQVVATWPELPEKMAPAFYSPPFDSEAAALSAVPVYSALLADPASLDPLAADTDAAFLEMFRAAITAIVAANTYAGRLAEIGRLAALPAAQAPDNLDRFVDALTSGPPTPAEGNPAGRRPEAAL